MIIFPPKVAFIYFGLIALSTGDPNLSYRLGTLSINMIERFGAMKYRSTIIGAVHQFLSWIRDPFQLVSEMHKACIGCRQGVGDDGETAVCRSFGLHTSYLAGENLVTLNENMRKYILKARQTQHSVFFVCSGETSSIEIHYEAKLLVASDHSFQVPCIVTYLPYLGILPQKIQ